jgi:hypothetical protein
MVDGETKSRELDLLLALYSDYGRQAAYQRQCGAEVGSFHAPGHTTVPLDGPGSTPPLHHPDTRVQTHETVR